jgi:hypothetical protein
MASTEIRDWRRPLRYRNLVLRQAVQMKNRVSGLLMETGVSYNKLRLHRMGYFTERFGCSVCGQPKKCSLSARFLRA